MRQKFLVNTKSGEKEIVADRYLIEGEEYVFYEGDEEVERIAISDIVETVNEDGEAEEGIKTIFSRSVM